MDDIRIVWMNISIGYDFDHCSIDVDKMMKRVPGIIRKQCKFIVK